MTRTNTTATRKRALVTGGSGDIGAAIAQINAVNGTIRQYQPRSR